MFVCFVDYQKAFDKVSHNKLVEIMERAEIPGLERRLIINLYWNQKAKISAVKENSREFRIERGV